MYRRSSCAFLGGGGSLIGRGRSLFGTRCTLIGSSKTLLRTRGTLFSTRGTLLGRSQPLLSRRGTLLRCSELGIVSGTGGSSLISSSESLLERMHLLLCSSRTLLGSSETTLGSRASIVGVGAQPLLGSEVGGQIGMIWRRTGCILQRVILSTEISDLRVERSDNIRRSARGRRGLIVGNGGQLKCQFAGMQFGGLCSLFALDELSHETLDFLFHLSAFACRFVFACVRCVAIVAATTTFLVMSF
jgi:hypothetical protein